MRPEEVKADVRVVCTRFCWTLFTSPVGMMLDLGSCGGLCGCEGFISTSREDELPHNTPELLRLAYGYKRISYLSARCRILGLPIHIGRHQHCGPCKSMASHERVELLSYISLQKSLLSGQIVWTKDYM